MKIKCESCKTVFLAEADKIVYCPMCGHSNDISKNSLKDSQEANESQSKTLKEKDLDKGESKESTLEDNSFSESSSPMEKNSTQEKTDINSTSASKNISSEGNDNLSFEIEEERLEKQSFESRETNTENEFENYRQTSTVKEEKEITLMLPLETGDRSMKAVLETLKVVIAKPLVFAETMKGSFNYKTALAFALLSSPLDGISRAAMIDKDLDKIQKLFTESSNLSLGGKLPFAAEDIGLFMILSSPISALISIFVSALFFHGIFYLLGGNGKLENMIRTVAWCKFGRHFLALIPGIGLSLEGLWSYSIMMLVLFYFATGHYRLSGMRILFGIFLIAFLLIPILMAVFIKGILT